MTGFGSTGDAYHMTAPDPTGAGVVRAMRQALAEAFRDGVPVGEETVPIDEGLSFTVTDGVLVASMDLTLDQRIIPAEEEDAELMEELNVNLEVH